MTSLAQMHTTSDIAKAWGKSPLTIQRTVRRLVKEGRLTVQRSGVNGGGPYLFTDADVAELRRALTPQAAPARRRRRRAA